MRIAGYYDRIEARKQSEYADKICLSLLVGRKGRRIEGGALYLVTWYCDSAWTGIAAIAQTDLAEAASGAVLSG